MRSVTGMGGRSGAVRGIACAHTAFTWTRPRPRLTRISEGQAECGNRPPKESSNVPELIDKASDQGK